MRSCGCGKAVAPNAPHPPSSKAQDPFLFLQTPVQDRHRIAFAALQPLVAREQNLAGMSKPSHFSRATEGGLAALAKWKSRWADRTVRVTVTPPPRTFAERRSVLQALKQRGPIEVFKAVPVRVNGLACLSQGNRTRQLFLTVASFTGTTSGIHCSYERYRHGKSAGQRHILSIRGFYA